MAEDADVLLGRLLGEEAEVMAAIAVRVEDALAVIAAPRGAKQGRRGITEVVVFGEGKSRSGAE